jgi:hypothetical protein
MVGIGMTLKNKAILIGTFAALGVFIYVGMRELTTLWSQPHSGSLEREQLDQLLGQPPQLTPNPMVPKQPPLQPNTQPNMQEDNAMTTPPLMPPSGSGQPTDPFSQMEQLMDKALRSQMQTMRQMQTDMQKQLNVQKPYTLTSTADHVQLTIPLRNKAEADEYKVVIFPHGFSITHNHTTTPTKDQPMGGRSFEQFQESYPETLHHKRAKRTVTDKQLVFTIPKDPDQHSLKRLPHGQFKQLPLGQQPGNPVTLPAPLDHTI